MSADDPVTDYEMAEAMRTYGGSFVQCLGRAWHHADESNRKFVAVVDRAAVAEQTSNTNHGSLLPASWRTLYASVERPHRGPQLPRLDGGGKQTQLQGQGHGRSIRQIQSVVIVSSSL